MKQCQCCAMYVDFLQPATLLSLTLQDDHVDIVLGIKNILKATKLLQVLERQDPLEWPTAKLVYSRIKEENGDKQYQGAILQQYNTKMLDSCKKQALGNIQQLDQKMCDRLKWSDIKMLHSILVLIDTQRWQKSESESDGDDESLGDIKVGHSIGFP